jgi:hypothetical protein
VSSYSLIIPTRPSRYVVTPRRVKIAQAAITGGSVNAAETRASGGSHHLLAGAFLAFPTLWSWRGRDDSLRDWIGFGDR